MTRVNVYRYLDEYDGTTTKTLAGWFDTDTADWFKEDTQWDGHNHRGVISGLQCGYEGLYRTKGGRWVRYYNARSEFNGPEHYEFIDAADAREWLLRCGMDDVATSYFGEVEEERGPGRPEVGPAVNVRFPEDLLAKLDARASEAGLSRAALVRELVSAGLSKA